MPNPCVPQPCEHGIDFPDSIQVYKVGGAVRDELLGRTVKDRDWVVVGATPERMIELGFKAVGKHFPVFLHPHTGEEYALARTERKTAPGHQGFSFYYAPNVTLEEDLTRRDLTINALAMDATGHLIDCVGGLEDIKNKTLRHVSPAFSEDPLRVLRVARFKASLDSLGFDISTQTWAMMQEITNSGELKTLSAERVSQEMIKALNTQAAEHFFICLHELGALAQIAQELEWLMNHDKNLALQRLSTATQQTTLPVLRFAALIQSLDDRQQTALHQALKLPKHWGQLAHLCQLLSKRLSSIKVLTAPLCLELLEQCDAFRRQDRFKQALLGASIILQTNAKMESKAKLCQQLESSLAKANQINAKKIIATLQETTDAITPQQIAQAIRDHRLKAIKESLI